ncbi:phage major capsid protein [Sporolactobacillus nakayamae]|uniref:Phage major capsid protein, HK97 family n=1 Tax=Sporolactobacillus nakayamae TaxID=269670 RepID=A0A1I2P4W8_9BACL|nr:phage major capsid protein [Sporolactobacillus nakayamae]SFG10520.1 phage major capsid protein, HK97 family [Sporolactobacillus nakayamae]
MAKKNTDYRLNLNLQYFGAKTLEEINKRKTEIRSLLEGEDTVDLEALEKELRDLNDQQLAIEKRQRLLKEAEAINNGTPPAGETRTIETFNNKPPEQRETETVETPQTETLEQREERGKLLKENRSVTVSSSNIILPRTDSNTINPTFNQVSSLIDRVKQVPLVGGESFRQPYVKDYGTGDYTAEGADYNETDPSFGYAEIAKTKVTAYTECSEELIKLPNADYEGQIIGGVNTAIRKKITREILVGDGSTGHLVGIFSAAAAAIDAAKDKEISAIDNTTLDEIIYSFGGDEDVEDASVLILNKQDLKAFSKVRDNNGNKFYTIVNHGNTGTIDGVPFIINSACKAVSDPATTAGQYLMAYGPLSNYSLAIFSNLDVQRSTDYKFKQGICAHRGDIFSGGNVTSKNGFLRVKKVLAG